jgi:hypothetical protein
VDLKKRRHRAAGETGEQRTGGARAMEQEETPHLRPEPTTADRAYTKNRDRLLQKAGQKLAEAERQARAREDYLRQRKGKP